MKKNIKKLIFSLALAVGLALGTAAVCSFASDYTDSQGVQYNITSYGEPRTASVAMDNDTSLSGSITIPSTITVDNYDYTVTEIEDSAFNDCRNLMSVAIPSSVTMIGSDAFYACSSLENVTIQEGVKVIHEWAFKCCSSLTSITIPSSVKFSDDSSLFSYCSKLTEINVAESNNYYCSLDGVLYNKDTTKLLKCPEGKEGTFIIPSSVTTIAYWAIMHGKLTSVIIPPSCTNFPEWTFRECPNLTDVYVKDGQGLGENPFLGDYQAINVWRYRVNSTQDGKTHVTITSVKNKDESDITTPIPLACNAMGDNYVIDSVECCSTGSATDGWAVYGVHDLEKTEAVEPTCTEEGNAEYWTCSHCGKHFSDAEGTTEIAEGDWVVHALGHLLTKTDAVEPTCTTEGNEEYYTCDRCGKYFSDENAENEIQEGDWVISATGHTYSGAWWPYDEENHADWCSKCGAYKTEPHSFETIKKEADDEYLGLDDRQCDVCQGHYRQYTLKEGTSPDKWYLISYNEGTEDKEVQEAYISDTIWYESVAPATVNVNDDPNKPVMIILQDPLGTLGGNEIRISASNAKENLDGDYDGNYKIENAYGVDITLQTKPIICRNDTFASRSSSSDGWVTKEGDLGGYVRLLMEIPDYDPNDPNDDWDAWETQAVRINEGKDTEYFERIEYQLYDSDGNFVRVVGKDYKPEGDQMVKKFVAFWTDHFSKYAAVDPEDVQPNSDDTVTAAEPETNKEADSTEESGSIETGDEINSYIMLEMVLLLAYVSLFVALRRRQKILLNEKK